MVPRIVVVLRRRAVFQLVSCSSCGNLVVNFLISVVFQVVRCQFLGRYLRWTFVRCAHMRFCVVNRLSCDDIALVFRIRLSSWSECTLEKWVMQMWY